ncbi:hypothetical protein PR048_029873 [Dryococelus australis]|uniref:DDE-1 domain-containing protein n=1 Tax=Dryococelus australis TaxID=614101 RepID=A0ABQ9G7E0_9NEOP|nr:hypothetical protein PR048_029873 [Dryococelus australis]
MKRGTWFYALKKRHPNISVRKPEVLCLAQARGANKEDVTKFLEMFENLLNENNLFGDPARIHNLNNRLEKILSKKGKRNAMNVTSKERGETVAVLARVSATRVFLPPFRKNMKQEFSDNLPPDSVVSMSDSGYITIELFQKFPEHFNLLVLDGHSAHVSVPDILQFAVDNNIIIISIPRHTSHYSQPLTDHFSDP